MNLRWWSYSWYHPYLLMFLHIFMYHFANKTIRRKMLLIFMNLSNYRVYTFGKMLSLKIKSFSLKLTMENNRGNKIISRVLFIFFTWCIFLNVHIAFSILYSDHLMKKSPPEINLTCLAVLYARLLEREGGFHQKTKSEVTIHLLLWLSWSLGCWKILFGMTFYS